MRPESDVYWTLSASSTRSYGDFQAASPVRQDGGVRITSPCNPPREPGSNTVRADRIRADLLPRLSVMHIGEEKICKRPLCPNPVEWSGKGRPPAYCGSEECNRVRHNDRERKSRQRKAPRKATPRNWGQPPEELREVYTEREWAHILRDAKQDEYLERFPQKPIELYQHVDETCAVCGKQLFNFTSAVRAFDLAGNRYRCQACAATA
jgi:hypothetical protein